MIKGNKDPLKEYKEAFMKFSDALESEFLIKQEGGALVLYENTTYRVCHYDDLVRDFKSHFDYNFTFIYIETPFDLWRTMFDLRQPTDLEDLIIDLYNAWNVYWEMERNQFTKKRDYDRSKAESLNHFKSLIEHLKFDPDQFIKRAIELEDITFIPIIAVALKSQYKDEMQFYKKCVNQLIENFPHTFSDDGNFDEMRIMNADGGFERYYIYQSDYDF